MLNKRTLFFIEISLLAALILAIFSCANQQRPSGGPKDVTPPVLLKATPPDMTRNFSAKIIKLDFDEYFKLVNPYQEITVSPTQETPPEYKIKKKSLVITIKDTLEKNTTYVINFGKAIQDVNEGNILKNFTYVFSTGPHIDSLSISGTVTNMLTQKKEKDVTVMLFPANKDSVYYGKKKPTIFTTTDTAGNFSLNNLPEGKFTIYALKETPPGDRVYDKDDELIAFLNKPVNLYTDTSDIQLNLFKQIPQKFRLVEHKFDMDGKIFFIFNKPLNKPSLKILYPPAFDSQKLVKFTTTRDSAYLYMRNMDFDSLSVAILSDNKPLDTIALMKGRKEKFTRSNTFGFNIDASDKLNPYANLIITTTTPIDSFDPTQITLKEDSATVNNFTVTRDTSDLSRFILKYHWKQDANTYMLTIGDGAFTNIYGEKNHEYIRKFQIDKVDNYSTLTLKVTVPDPKKAYIVEIYQNISNIIRRQPITRDTSIVYANFYAGKYNIRVVYDDNRNGKWDTGNVKEKRQPENIWIDPQQITLRPNWDAEETLAIPREASTY